MGKAMIFPADAYETWTQLVMNRFLTDDPDEPVEQVNTLKVWLQAEAAEQTCLKATCLAVFSESEKSGRSDHSDSASQTSDEHFIMRLKFTDLEIAPRLDPRVAGRGAVLPASITAVPAAAEAVGKAAAARVLGRPGM